MEFSKHFLNKLLNKLILATLTVTCTQFTGKLDATIPEYKGLYTLFETENTNAKSMPEDKIIKTDKVTQADKVTPTDTVSQADNPAQIVDTIGMGQAFLYSSWLENVYTYADKDNAARKVISILWFKRLYDKTGNFNRNANFHVSENYPTKKINAKDLGKIIKYLREFSKYNPDGSKKFSQYNTDGTKKNTEDIKAQRCEFARSFRKDLRSGTNEEALINFLIALEELDNDENFFKGTAEAILWAFFERKFDGETDFKSCLDTIDPALFEKLNRGQYSKIDFEAIKKNNCKKFESIARKILNSKGAQKPISQEQVSQEQVSQEQVSQEQVSQEQVSQEQILQGQILQEQISQEPISQEQISGEEKDELIYCTIKSSKKSDIPRSIEWANIIYKNPITGTKTDQLTTCFESAILEFISILLYDREKKEYDPSILPENITNGEEFNKVLRNIFYTDTNSSNNSGENSGDKIELIDSEKTNLRIQAWVDMITNLPELEYNKQTVEKTSTYFDLRGTITNFIKCINKFLSLGLTIKDTEKLFAITEPDGTELQVKNDCLKDWQVILDKIAAKLSTKKRPVNFSVKTVRAESACPGTFFDAKEIDGSIGETTFTIQLRNAHGEIVVKKIENNETIYTILNNIKCQMGEYLENFTKEFPPLFLLTNKSITLNSNKPQIFGLSLFSPDLNSQETVTNIFYKILYENSCEQIRFLNQNNNIKNLISNLISAAESNNKDLLNKLIYLKLKYPKENFWDKETYLYIQKSIKNELEQKNTDKYFFNNFHAILKFAEECNTEINPDRALQKIIMQIIELNKSHYCYFTYLTRYYMHNLKYNSTDKDHLQEIREKISNTIKYLKKEKNILKLAYACKDLANIKISDDSNKFIDDFVKELFIDIIKKEKLDLKELVSDISGTSNEQALDLLPVEEVIKNDNSALVNAINSNSYNIVKKLLAYKNINVNSNKIGFLESIFNKIFNKDKNNKSCPLIEAIKENFSNSDSGTEIIKQLLSHEEIDVNETDNKTTALIEAIKNAPNNGIIPDLLLFNKKININKPDYDRETPLHHAISRFRYLLHIGGHKKDKLIDIIKKIISFEDIDMGIKNRYQNKTPIELAKDLAKNFEIEKKDAEKHEAFKTIIKLLEDRALELEEKAKIKEIQLNQQHEEYPIYLYI